MTISGNSTAIDFDALGIEAASLLCDEWRSQNLRIGFTNGCFDILHAGHLSLLDFCARHCDRLIIAINDDASVAKLKGSNRPAQDLQTRITILHEHSAAHAIIAFSEDTPLHLIKKLRPDVLIKGGDYTRDTIIGAEFVEQQGGQVLTAPFQAGFSSTTIIEEI